LWNGYNTFAKRLNKSLFYIPFVLTGTFSDLACRNERIIFIYAEIQILYSRGE